MAQAQFGLFLSLVNNDALLQHSLSLSLRGACYEVDCLLTRRPECGERNFDRFFVEVHEGNNFFGTAWKLVWEPEEKTTEVPYPRAFMT